MEIIAIAKSVRMGPRKVRLIAEAIKNLSPEAAMRALLTMEKRAATPLAKLLKSAVANAVNNANLDKANLKIASINVTEGQALKRSRPSTRGGIHPYKKRSANIRLVLKEKTNKN